MSEPPSTIGPAHRSLWDRLGHLLTGEPRNPGELLEELRELPRPVQKAMVAKFELMLETATAVDQVKRADQSKRVSDKRPSFVRDEPDWHMLTSRN